MNGQDAVERWGELKHGLGILEISTKPGFHKEKIYVLKDVLMPYTLEIIFLPNHSMVCLPLHLPSQPTSHLSIQPSICLLSPTHPFICLSIKSIIHTSVHLSRHPPPSISTRLCHWLTVYSVGRRVCKITSGWSGQMQEAYKGFPWEHGRGPLSLYLVHQS